MGKKSELKTALKPCPFCGSTEVTLDAVDRGRNREGSAVWAQCRDCGTSTAVKLTEWEAVETWNRRACACGEIEKRNKE